MKLRPCMMNISQPCRSKQPDMIKGQFMRLCIYNICGRGLAQASQLLQHPKCVVTRAARWFFVGPVQGNTPHTSLAKEPTGWTQDAINCTLSPTDCAQPRLPYCRFISATAPHILERRCLHLNKLSDNH